MNSIQRSKPALTAADEPLDSRRLRAFVLLAKEASFASAAAALSLTPSAMSHSIKALEEEMGTPLFERRGHRAVLTSAGERLLPHAERILRTMRTARQEIQSLQAWGSGVLRIAAPASACQYFLPAVLLEFRECFPNGTLNITAADTDAAVALVEEGRVDLAVCIGSGLNSSMKWTPLFNDRLSMYVSPMHPWASAKKLARKDIATQAVIVYDLSAVTAKLVFESLKKTGVRPADVLSLGSMEAIKEMVKVGLGVGILAPWVTAREREAGTLVSVPFPIAPMNRSWGAASYAGQKLSFMAETFLGLCKDVTSTLPA